MTACWEGWQTKKDLENVDGSDLVVSLEGAKQYNFLWLYGALIYCM